MKLAAAEFLRFRDLAKAWASEPDSRSCDYILAQLLSAYWKGVFEKLLDQVPDRWPRRMATLGALRGCGGIPPEAMPIEDEGEPNWDGLGGVFLDNYTIPGQAVMNAVELPRDMIRLWCQHQNYELPKFWFPTEQDAKTVGRPTLMHHLIKQMMLRHARKELETTIAAEAHALRSWAVTNLGHEQQIPKSRSIENSILTALTALRKIEINNG